MSNFKERNEHFARAMADAQVSYIEAERAACDLEADNRKLRELCADVWHLFTEHGAVHPCDLPTVDAVRERMCELGVEVDG